MIVWGCFFSFISLSKVFIDIYEKANYIFCIFDHVIKANI